MNVRTRGYLMVVGGAVALVLAISLSGAFSDARRSKTSGRKNPPEPVPQDVGGNESSLRSEVLNIPVPDVVANAADARERYEKLQDCMTFRNFERIFQLNADNPEYPLNNPEAMRSMPLGERKMLIQRAELVESKRKECGSWASSVSDLDAGRLMYDSALKAARAGDVQAGVCYAMGLWPATPASDPVGAREYADTRRQFVLRGLESGNWSAVIAAINMANAEHGPQTQVRFSDQEKYIFARLLQMGMPDKGLSESYGYEAASRAKGLNSAQLRSSNARAEQLFLSTFGGRVMSEEERYENCGN